MSITQNVNSSNQRDFCLMTYDKINHSPTQMKYSFSKANRFPPVRQVSDVGANYDIPGTNGSRAAGMGFGISEVFKGKRGKLCTFFFLTKLCSHVCCARRFSITRQVQSRIVLRSKREQLLEDSLRTAEENVFVWSWAREFLENCVQYTDNVPRCSCSRPWVLHRWHDARRG